MHLSIPAACLPSCLAHAHPTLSSSLNRNESAENVDFSSAFFPFRFRSSFTENSKNLHEISALTPTASISPPLYPVYPHSIRCPSMTTAAFECVSLAANTCPNLPRPLRKPSSMSATLSPAYLSIQLIGRRPQYLLQRRSFVELQRGRNPSNRLGCRIDASGGRRMRMGDGLIIPFAASHEESKSPEVDIEEEKDRIAQETKESQEAWEQMLASFKEQALRLQSVSQEAYETYTKKATITLRETAETLKIQADKARDDLSVVARDLSEEGKQYLATAAERSPEPVKDVVETFASSTEDLNHISKVPEFYVGVPYGAILSFGGFLNFMVTGSISAIRFGVILGGVLLALSVYSLRLWRKGESSSSALNAKAVIAGIIFLREMRLLFQGPTLIGVFNTMISCAVAAFFVYRIKCNQQSGKTNLDGPV